MADISQITLPSGNTYTIKDAAARAAIAALEGGSWFLGKSLTALSDGATTNPINIDGKGSVTATNGNIAVYGNAEFIWDGSKWIEFGDLSNLGSLAYKSTVALSKGSGKNVLGASASFTSTVTPTTASVPNVTSAGSASTWSFTMGTGTAAETLIIEGANGSAPTLGTAISAMTGATVATTVNSVDTTKVAEYADLDVSVS
jgi:hypothetical protein